MIKKGIGSMFTMKEYNEEFKSVKEVEGMKSIGMSGFVTTLGAWGRYKKKLDICEEIGEYIGMFYMEDGKYYIDNFEELFEYNTCEELLFDWLGTIKESEEAIGDGTWLEAIQFIEKLKRGEC